MIKNQNEFVYFESSLIGGIYYFSNAAEKLLLGLNRQPVTNDNLITESY